MLVVLAGCLSPTACSSRPTATTLHDLAEQYVRVTLQIAQHRPNLVDAWTGPPEWEPGPRVPVAALRTEVERLLAAVEALHPDTYDPAEASRVTYLRGQLRALALVTRRLLGDTTRFAEEVDAAFGVRLPQPDEQALEHARREIDRALPGDGPLDERYRAYRQQFVVPAARIEPLVHAALDACRAATGPHVVLPADERVTFEFDEALEWDAYAQYRGAHETHVRVGSPGGHDIAALLRMTCHETYAGHHAQHILVDDALVKGRGWLEFQLTPAFGPHHLISEGAAEAGVDLALSEEQRAAIYRERLLPLAGLEVGEADRLAHIDTLASALDRGLPWAIAKYLDNESASADVIRILGTRLLVPSPGPFLSFAERQRTNAVVYPIGKAVVSEWVARGATTDDRWRRYQDLFTRTPFALD